MNSEQLDSALRVLTEQSNLLTEKRAAWDRQLLVAACALFGILISLQNTSSQPTYTRWVFALSIVLLALGILLSAVALYRPIDGDIRGHRAYLEEVISANNERREMKNVIVPERRVFLLCAKVSYICFGLSVLLLAAYVVLLTFDFTFVPAQDSNLMCLPAGR
jgi:hypothetical protein